MSIESVRKLKLAIILIILICMSYAEAKRYKTSGGRRTTPRSHPQHTTRRNDYHYTTTTHRSIGFENVQQHVPPQNNRQDIGFENVQNRIPPQNNQPHVPDNYHQTHVNPVSSGNPHAPSAPNIGFDNVQNRVPPLNNQPHPAPSPNIGFDNVQNRVPPLNNQPHPSNIGFDNVQHRNPQYNQPQPGLQNPGGYPGFGGGYNPHAQQPGGHPGNYYQNPPNLYQPQGSYYNPHYGSPGGIPPSIYQPPQQSKIGTVLGYAGTFAGGYLIGRLLDGGGDRKYEVHHYHHNAKEVPKQIKVTDNSLITCTQNETQGLCVPNTFPICLSNGTIMCVTHTPYTVACGSNSSLACVVTVLPCASNDSSCNSTANFTNTAVYVPCISNVTVAKQKVVNATGESTANRTFNTTNVELCVTAIAEPKRMESPTGSFFQYLTQLLMLPLELNQTLHNSTNSMDVATTTTTTTTTTTVVVTTVITTFPNIINVSMETTTPVPIA